MIAAKAHRYCREDLSLVENYAEALADNTRTWHIHHRDEIKILPSGMVVRRSIQDLIDAGRYYNCPANELIFVTPELHNTMHFRGCVGPRKGSTLSTETRKKLREANLGKHYSPEVNAKKGRTHSVSPETREKIRQKALGRTVSPELRARISAKLKGRNVRAEAKMKEASNA